MRREMKRRRRDVGELAGCPRKMAVVGGGPSFSFTHNSIVDSDEFWVKIWMAK